MTQKRCNIEDVLGEIRAGDADILDDMATWFACSDDPDQFSRQIEILHRYRDIAKQMGAIRTGRC